MCDFIGAPPGGGGGGGHISTAQWKRGVPHVDVSLVLLSADAQRLVRLFGLTQDMVLRTEQAQRAPPSTACSAPRAPRRVAAQAPRVRILRQCLRAQNVLGHIHTHTLDFVALAHAAASLRPAGEPSPHRTPNSTVQLASRIAERWRGGWVRFAIYVERE
eukprot:scaffold149_cov383-Prasinococcus_capsulatus_cf.AAC.2